MTAWAASTSYPTLGVRRSNGGQAWQLIATGTSASSGGPTGTTRYVVDGTCTWMWLSAIDATSLSGAAALVPSTYVDDYYIEIWNDQNPTITTTAGTQIMNVGAKTVNGHLLVIEAAPGESHIDAFRKNPNQALTYNTALGVSIQLPGTGAGNINYLQFTPSNTILRNIQIKDPNSTSNCTLANFDGGNCYMQNCIIDGYAQAGGAYMIAFNGGGIMTQCVLTDRQASGGTNNAVQIVGTGSGVYACTFYGANSPASAAPVIQASNTSITCANNFIFGYGIFYANNASGTLTAYNTLGNGTNLGTNVTNGGNNSGGVTMASCLVSATGTDFRQLATSSGFGAADETREGGAIGTIGALDIMGQPRLWRAGVHPDLGPAQILRSRPYQNAHRRARLRM